MFKHALKVRVLILSVFVLFVESVIRVVNIKHRWLYKYLFLGPVVKKSVFEVVKNMSLVLSISTVNKYCFGSVSGLDPASFGLADTDPDCESGSMQTKIVPKNCEKIRNLMFDEYLLGWWLFL